MLRLERMMAFARVVEAQGFSSAARDLGISKSFVSKQVAALEAELGVRLLHRTTRRLSLTEAGQTLYAHCARIGQEAAAASEAVTRLRAEPSGTLRVSAPVSFSAFQLAPLLEGFLARYPAVRIDLDTSDRAVDLADEGFDIALRISQRPADGLVARRIFPLRWMTCASPSYLARHGPPADPAALRAHRCIAYEGRPTTVEWRYRRGGEEIRVSPDGNCRVNQGAVAMQLALAGMGFVHVPHYMVERDLQEGRLVSVLDDWESGPPDSALFAVWLPNRDLPPKVRAFVEFIVAHFGSAPAAAPAPARAPRTSRSPARAARAAPAPTRAAHAGPAPARAPGRSAR